MPDPNAAPRAQEIEDIYRDLTRGLGHERVDDRNVFDLIRRAEEDGRKVLAQELREWQAPCDPDKSDTSARAPGVDAESKRH
ncbi:MAG: hypothetical protein M9885_00675 [Burkholderiaceae bacterium]|nr:hypothetical protein [Burkholderiaceae bacterium]